MKNERKNVLVTGASSGVGYELVKEFIRHEAIGKVIAVARRKERLDELLDFEASLGLKGKCSVITADVCSVESDRIFSGLEHLDVLVNNAGAFLNAPFDQMSEQDLRDVYDVNVFAPYRLTRLAMPLLRRAPNAHVVNIGSMGGVQGAVKFPGLSAYSSSKGALAILTECLAEEHKESSLSFNCLAFGAVQTEMLSKAFPDMKAPLNSVEMAEYVCDFCLNGHNYFNGKVLPVSSTTP